MYGSLVITENPVTAWEQFHEMFHMQDLIDVPRVVKRDMGGYHSMTFEMVVEEAIARQYLSQGVGRNVELFYEDGRTAWEGMISAVELDTGTARIRTTIDNMGNYVWVRHQPVGGGAAVRSNIAENAASQARYGYKHWVIAGGELDAGVADQMAEKWLRGNYWPQPVLDQISFDATSMQAKLKFNCIGYYHTLNWCVYNQTALSGEADADSVISAILADAHVGQFIESTDIRTNVTQVTQEFDADRRAKDILESIAALGDVSYLPWVVGVGPGREFYYRPAGK